jgi:aldehyde dehydrogenase (NAD+)
VERPVFDAVRERMAERYRALRVGPAMDDLDIGPVISARQRRDRAGLPRTSWQAAACWRGMAR